MVQILFPSSSADNKDGAAGPLTANLSPLDDHGVPAGRIFIGLGTHQTTGSSFHVHAQLIPTIERENVDYQDPYLVRSLISLDRSLPWNHYWSCLSV